MASKPIFTEHSMVELGQTHNTCCLRVWIRIDLGHRSYHQVSRDFVHFSSLIRSSSRRRNCRAWRLAAKSETQSCWGGKACGWMRAEGVSMWV